MQNCKREERGKFNKMYEERKRNAQKKKSNQLVKRINIVSIKMFKQENRYVSREVNKIVPVEIQILIWSMIDKLKYKIELDYLQIFKLKKKNGKVIIEHEQEVPPYKEQYELQESDISIEHNIKIYVIDSIDYSTMILAEEY